MNPPADLRDLARRVRSLPFSCGPVRLVAVDGHAGSGKTTLAGHLARVLGDAPVLHLDDLASHDAFFDWTRRLTDQVTDQLARGRHARFRVYDWHEREFLDEATLPPSPVVVLEGVGAGRAALRPHLACLLWIEVPRREAWARGMSRDGPCLADFWREWTGAERAHFRADPSRPYAHFLLCEDPPGYTVMPGPAGPAQGAHRVTTGDESTDASP